MSERERTSFPVVNYHKLDTGIEDVEDEDMAVGSDVDATEMVKEAKTSQDVEKLD